MRTIATEADTWIAAGWLAVLPAWLISVLAHLLIAIAGCLILGRGGPVDRDDGVARQAEIVLADRTADGTRYFADDETARQRHQVLRPVSSPASESLAVRGGEGGGVPAETSPPPLVAGIRLPELNGELVAGDGLVAGFEPGARQGKVRLPTSALDEAAILAEDARIPREQVATGPTAELSLFGSGNAVGRSFVFVIDRSTSMGGDGLGAIQAAAKELTTQLGRLSSEQTFQVVAYNEATLYLTQRELIPATSENKQKLVQFIAGLPAFGQTEHARGLSAALRLKPEVVFLLTDGGDPPLHAGQLRQIREEAAGRTAIHVLHFGRGKASAEQSFLEQLAAENRGSYAYIDMSRR